MKILEVCPYSAGVCGVFNRVLTESIALKEMGHEVIVFSSNATKGSKEIAPSEEVIDGIKINRIKFRKLGGESFMRWDRKWIDHAVILKPDLILCHGYRHLHTTDSLKIAEILNGK